MISTSIFQPPPCPPNNKSIPVEVLKEQVNWDLGKIAQRTRSPEIRTLVLKVKGCLQGIDQLNNVRRSENV